MIADPIAAHNDATIKTQSKIVQSAIKALKLADIYGTGRMGGVVINLQGCCCIFFAVLLL